MIELPSEKTKASRVNPKKIILFSKFLSFLKISNIGEKFTIVK